MSRTRDKRALSLPFPDPEGRGSVPGHRTAGAERELRRTSYEPRLAAFIDGAARGNPGPAAIGVVICGEGGIRVAALGRTLGKRTNNQAEYEALLAALCELLKLKPSEAVIKTDSELLFCQMTGSYRVKNPQLRELHKQANRLLAQLPGVWFERIPRESNREADRLANKALDAQKKGSRNQGKDE